MTEVTRIACPGCRGLLRFEPEALDFPANCGGCDCRFEVEIQVRVTCPKCHSKSKIPDNARDYQIRCGRCQHEYLGHDGIAAGGGGRLLVARMLDTDSPNPPETIQPYVGHAREEAERKSNSPSTGELQRLAESERLKAEAIAERDRMVHETGLFKALLARLVSTPAGDLSGDPGLAEALSATLDPSGSAEHRKGAGAPVAAGRDDLATLRAAEEKKRLEDIIGQLRGQLDQARAEVSRHGTLVADQIALADREVKARHLAERKLLKLKAELDRTRAEAEAHRERLDTELPLARKLADDEKQLADQKLVELRDEIQKTKAEADQHRDRLLGELPLAQKAADEAHQQWKSVEEKLAQTALALQEAERKAARMVIDHGKALFDAEQERAGLSMTIERLTQAVISARTGEEEALDRLEEYSEGLVASDAAMANELNAERQRNLDLDQVVDSLNQEIDALRQDQVARSKAREAELAELKRRSEEDRLILVAEVERARAHAEEAAIQLAQAREKLDASNAIADQLRAAAAELEADHRAELERVRGASEGHGEAREVLAVENRKLIERADQLASENRELSQVAEEAAALRLENQHLGQAASLSRQECQRLSEVVAAGLVEKQRLESSTGDLQRLKQENDRLQSETRRLAALSEQSGTPRQQNQKLADAIETAELLHLDNVRLGNIVEVTKAEGDRKQKALVLEIQRIKQEYEKLVASNEKLVDRVQQLLGEKMAHVEAAHTSNGIKPVTPSMTLVDDRPPVDRRPDRSAIESSSTVTIPASRSITTKTALAADAEFATSRNRDPEMHRDFAFSAIYSEHAEEKRKL